MSKSKIYGIGVPVSETQNWASGLGCGVGSLPFLYLGLPVSENMSRKVSWKVVIEKLEKRLAGWKTKFISFGGKLTLVKSVLGSLALYYFALFRAPRGVIQELERVRSVFFWGGGKGTNSGRSIPWVKWERVVRDLESGGLNVGCLQEANWTLLAKWWWRFYVEKRAFWVKIIKSIYGPEGNLVGDSTIMKRKGTVWSNIGKVGRELDKMGLDFSGSFGIEVGNRKETRMWEDKWMDGLAFKDSYPRLYQLETQKDIPIAECGNWWGDEWRWDWRWLREPRGRAEGELESLTDKIRGWKPRIERKDRPKWTLGNDGEFSLCDLKLRIRQRIRSTAVGVTESWWSRGIPKKVCVFIWRLRLGRLPCRVTLDKMGLDIPSLLCPRCDTEIESIDHALVNCPLVVNVWKRFYRWWSVPCGNISTIDDVFVQNSIAGNRFSPNPWSDAVWSFMYFIWEHRNNMVFRQDKKAVEGMFFEMQRRSFEWIGKRNSGNKIDWMTWLTDPRKTIKL